MKGVNEHAIGGMLRPVDLDIHMIGNPTMNYGSYLANMMLPGVLEMIIIIIIIYSFGTELKYGTSRHLLHAAGGKMADAVTGKLTIYTLLFLCIGYSLVFLLYWQMGFRFEGSISAMLINMTLFVISSECIGVFIIGCIPVLRFALSIGALMSVMAFSLTGFTLPVEAMPSYIQGGDFPAQALLPVLRPGRYLRGRIRRMVQGGDAYAGIPLPPTPGHEEAGKGIHLSELP